MKMLLSASGPCFTSHVSEIYKHLAYWLSEPTSVTSSTFLERLLSLARQLSLSEKCILGHVQDFIKGRRWPYPLPAMVWLLSFEAVEPQY